MDVFQRRRDKLETSIGEGVLILQAKCEQTRSNDVLHTFRQDSHFLYFTGFDQPDAVLIFRPGKDPKTIMFVRPKNPEKEIWDGPAYGPDETRELFKVDAAYDLSQLEKKLPDLLEEALCIYYRWGKEHFDSILKKALMQVQERQGRSGRGFPPLFDYWEILGEQRVIKTDQEITYLRKACQLSADAHINAMRFTTPNVSERQVEGVLEYTVKKADSSRWGYYPIVASGSNACILHYQSNNQVCKNGDLLLIDAGAEWNYYTADITRTFPVNGKFTDIQKDFYQNILEVQKNLIVQAKPGVTFEFLQNKTIKCLSQILLDWKLLKTSLDEAISKKLYKKYYPHFIGHFLGMDVHDVGLYKKNNQPRPLEPGICLTIEPGLYIPQNDQMAPESLRGTGIRIEDDVLICEDGNEVLSCKAPKEVDDLQEVIGQGIIL